MARGTISYLAARAARRGGKIMPRKSDLPLALLERMGIFRGVHTLMPNTLTVLNYHRIADPIEDGYETFRPNISATPENFALQLDYLLEHFNVISGAELSAWLYEGRELPPHAAMITFDDGYRDNWENAYPLLRERHLPAIIFLTTDYIDKKTPFYWDVLAYAFRHSSKTQAVLPMIGKQNWQTDDEMIKVMLAWTEVGKCLPNTEKEKALQETLKVLDVLVPKDALQGLALSWDQIREMAENGIEMGSHTVSHPILTRIPAEQVKKELEESKKRIESELEKPVISFAYPNGGAADFTRATQGLLRELGYRFAFSLLPGPTRYATVKKNPYTIRRTFLRNADTMGRFVAKITGLTRILKG